MGRICEEEIGPVVNMSIVCRLLDDMRVWAQSESLKGHIRSINNMGHCSKLSLPGTQTVQSTEVEQSVGMVWRPTAATRAASSSQIPLGQHFNFQCDGVLRWAGGQTATLLPIFNLGCNSKSLAVLKVT